MEKKDYNQLLDSWKCTKETWFNNNVDSIRKILKECVNNDSALFKTKKILNISNLDELHKSDGFYMIFNTEDDDCDCKISIDGKTFTCVYRGESSELTDRLTSHLFNGSASQKYTTCMRINGNNVDLSKNSLNLEWLVVTYGMNGSTSEFRRMFEKAFDEEFKRPKYSIEK